jgi:hypothetical protein
MKNGKTVENVVHVSLMRSIVVEISIIGLLLLISVFSSLTNWEIQPILRPIRIVIILLIISIALQASVLIYKILSKERICPKCQTPLPKWRIPKNRYEVFVGGWTCPSCGTKLTWQLRERT